MPRAPGLVVLALIAACATPKPGPRTPEGAERAAQALRDLTRLHDEMCACGGAACAQSVAYEAGQLDDANRETPFDDAEREQARILAEAMADCMRRAGAMTR